MTSRTGPDHASTANFYATARGRAAAACIAQSVARLWPDLTGLSVLGLGFTAPFLSLWHGQARRCLNATASQHAPPPGACHVDALRLPFPDLVFDRILVIHGVEDFGHDARLLREIWRVLRDDGRILVVAPNRTGLWAQIDNSPFGQGHPYSQGQINRLLASGMFRPERRDCALFTPPADWGVLLRMSGLWEHAGRVLTPQLAGVTVTEAVKDVYAALPTAAVARRRVVQPEAA